jgi:hypothetical protein
MGCTQGWLSHHPDSAGLAVFHHGPASAGPLLSSLVHSFPYSTLSVPGLAPAGVQGHPAHRVVGGQVAASFGPWQSPAGPEATLRDKSAPPQQGDHGIGLSSRQGTPELE